MNELSEQSAIEVYEWYFDIERRFQDIVRVVPFSTYSELSGIHSPRLASVLLEAASLIDALFRSQMPRRFVRSNGRKTTSDNANIVDYKSTLEPELCLAESKSLLLKGVPELISPFAPWGQDDHTLDWWGAYNGIKHDRLAHSDTVTLEHCLLALCALNQLILKIPSCVKLVFRFGWSDPGGYNPTLAIQELSDPRIAMGYIAYTEFFATFINPVGFSRVEDIRPVMFRNSERLEAHLGRLGTKAESE